MVQTFLGNPEAPVRAEMATWTVSQLEAMSLAGVLPDDWPFELVEGLLVRKDRSDRRDGSMIQGRRHSVGVAACAEVLHEIVRTTAFHVRVQLLVRLSDSNLPEPDVCIVRGATRDYRDHHPGPDELALVVEVADSSLEFDRTVKLPAYARAGVPCVWIVNLVEGLVEEYAMPSEKGERYQSIRRASDKETLALTLNDSENVVVVRDLL